jgi:hypothetical protein
LTTLTGDLPESAEAAEFVDITITWTVARLSR